MLSIITSCYKLWKPETKGRVFPPNISSFLMKMDSWDGTHENGMTHLGLSSPRIHWTKLIEKLQWNILPTAQICSDFFYYVEEDTEDKKNMGSNWSWVKDWIFFVKPTNFFKKNHIYRERIKETNLTRARGLYATFLWSINVYKKLQYLVDLYSYI